MLAFVRFWWNKYWVLQSDVVLLMWFVKFPVKPTVCVRLSAHKRIHLHLSVFIFCDCCHLSVFQNIYTHKVTGDLKTAWSYWPLTSSLEIMQHCSSNPLSARCPPKSPPHAGIQHTFTALSAFLFLIFMLRTKIFQRNIHTLTVTQKTCTLFWLPSPTEWNVHPRE